MTKRLAMVVCSALLWASGCVVDNPVAYNECVGAKDCSSVGADVCQPISITWPGSAPSTTSICTTSCADDFDCSLSGNGEYGLCANNAILGAPAGTCFERCNYDLDCAPDFLCVDNKDVAGLEAYERICVPGWTVEPPLYDYESCYYSGVCEVGCVDITQTWSSTTNVDAICSRPCSADSDCAQSFNGQYGYCSKSGILAAAAGTCFERCYYDTDCVDGFVCAGDKDVYGLDIGTQICVPGSPSLPQKQDPYATCSTNVDCPSNAAYCAEINPKWTTTTAQFALDICTVGCSSHASCPGGNGFTTGFCAPAGSVATTAVCVERCTVQGDCAAGFFCAAANYVQGINVSDGVCLPDVDTYGY